MAKQKKNSAPFKLVDYFVNDINFRFDGLKDELEFKINPRGEYNSKKSEFKLFLSFSGYNPKKNQDSVNVEMEGIFKFKGKLEIEQIPDFFYVNSVAIVFPYLRSMISLITMQSNRGMLILPTMNLMHLAEPLKLNTITV